METAAPDRFSGLKYATAPLLRAAPIKLCPSRAAGSMVSPGNRPQNSKIPALTVSAKPVTEFI